MTLYAKNIKLIQTELSLQGHKRTLKLLRGEMTFVPLHTKDFKSIECQVMK